LAVNVEVDVLKKKWVLLLTLGALSCLSSRADEWMTLNGTNTFCRRLTQSVIMRDPSSCGATNIFCTIPVQCFQGNVNFVTTVMCKALPKSPGRLEDGSIAALSVPQPQAKGCPSLQRCADDPEPQLAYESDLPKWTTPPENFAFKGSLGH